MSPRLVYGKAITFVVQSNLAFTELEHTEWLSWYV